MDSGSVNLGSSPSPGAMEIIKTPYICYALTELDPAMREEAKRFYERVADTCKEVLGVRGFIPHEHADPVQHIHLTPREVDVLERKRVMEETSLLLVVALAPSWGGGIEVEMANQRNIPIIILAPQEKLDARKVSRLLRGNPAVRHEIGFTDYEDAIQKLREVLQAFKE